MNPRTFLEEYQIGHGLLGEGSQGQVLKARHKITNQMVAVKVISLTTDSGVYAFENEVKTFLRLENTPGIVRLRDHYRGKQEGVLVFDMLEHNLMHECVRRESISEYEASNIFRRICVAVQNMHQSNLAHLDLKPENILLDTHGAPHLCDMGAAAAFRNSYRYRGCRGTPGYSAPEMKNNGYYFPPAADMWSLGIILHILLVGCFPYEESGASGAEQFDIAHFYPMYMHSHNLSRHARSLLASLLSFNPKNRPTIQQVLEHPFVQPITPYESRTKSWIVRSVRHITKKIPRSRHSKQAAARQGV